MTLTSLIAGNSTGRGFNGHKHGNGVLTSDGNGDVTTWPGTDAVDAGLRGGGWASTDVHARLSAGTSASETCILRNNSRGGRGVRSAP